MLSEEKVMAIVKEINNEPGGMDRLGRLGACSDSLFGFKLEGTSWYKNKLILGSLFQYLMSLDVPPTEVSYDDTHISLVWEPIDEVEFKNQEDYIRLYLQFQSFIDSVKELDLIINFAAKYSDYDSPSGVKRKRPMEFAKENFVCGHEIMFLDITGESRQCWLSYETLFKKEKDSDNRLDYINTKKIF